MATDDEAPTIPEESLGNRDVERLRDSIKKVASEDTFGGRFTLIGQAGEGGMGVVYEAKDRDKGRRVAIKVITGLPSPTERARFAAEAEALEKLDHPAIVKYVEHGLTSGGQPYLAMEWLVGESLAARLARGPLTVDETAVLGERIADALDHAHERGVVHRDLKPSNIFLVDGKLYEAHLIDFGVAKHGDKDLTHTGQMIGTPGYMAPEQVRGEKSVGASVDLFALGCVLYKALTGRDAFAGQEVMVVLARLLLEDPQPIETLVPEVPPRLAHLIGSLLSKDPARRLGDAAVVCSELRAIRSAIAANNSEELALKPEEVPTPVQVAPVKHHRVPMWLVALAAGGLVVAIATLVITFMKRETPAPAPAPTTAKPPICNEHDSSGCKALCDVEDAAACFLLARVLHDVKDDHESGRMMDVRACRLKNGDGCFQAGKSYIGLAKMLAKGDARRAQHLKDAEKLYQAGCDLSHSESCRELGKQLSKGHGLMPPDPPRAYTLVEKACGLDNAKACKAITDIVGDPDNGGTPEMRAQLTQARKAACERRKANPNGPLADLLCDP